MYYTYNGTEATTFPLRKVEKGNFLIKVTDFRETIQERQAEDEPPAMVLAYELLREFMV